MNRLLQPLVRIVALLTLLLWGQMASATLLLGVTISEFDDNFRNLIRQHIEQYGKELDVDLVVENASSDPKLQLRQVRNYIQSKVDAIVILPVDAATGREALSLASAAKIPVVFANSDPEPTSWPAGSAYVGSKETDAGTMQMEELAKLAGYKGDVVILEGEPGHSGAIGRTKAVEAVVAKYPDMKVVKKATANWQSSEAATLVAQWLKESPFKVVAANNDSMAIGAVLGLEKSGKPLGDFLVGGIDGTREALQMMGQDKIEVSVLQDARGQARKAVDVALMMLAGNATESHYWIPFQLITRDNMAQFSQ